MKIIPTELNEVTAAVQQAYPPYQELDYEALSKVVATPSQQGSDFESLLPVQLPPEWDSDYNTILFTRKNLTSVRRTQDKAAQRQAAKGNEPEDSDDLAGRSKNKNAAAPQMMRESYTLLANYLAEISGVVNVAFDQSRMALVQAQDFAVADTMDEKARLSTMFENRLNFNLESVRDEESIDSASSAFLINLQAGNTHIIRQSQRYPGGYDIMFTSNPGALMSLKFSGDPIEVPTSRFNTRMAAMRAEGGHLSQPVGKAAAKYSRELITAIFGADAATPTTQSKRVTKILPIDFNFKKALKSVEKNLSVVGIDPRPIGEAALVFPQVFPEAFNKFFSLVAVLDASPLAINEKSKGALDTDVAEESLYMQPNISFTIALNLPEPVVAFITQTLPGARIPLAPLHIWATVWASAYLAKRSMEKGKRSGGGVPLSSVPKYVLSASRTKELMDKRKELKFYSEPGRSNDEHMYVSNIGTLNYCPKADDLILDNAKNYESLMEDALQVSYDAGAPLMILQVEESHPVFGANSPEYRNKIRNYKDSIKKYAGSMQAFSWDYNCILTVALGAPDKLNAIRLMGAATPDALSVADYLQRPFSKSMQLLFVRSHGVNEDKTKVSTETFGQGQYDITGMFDTTIFKGLRQFYTYLLEEKAVPDFQELVNRAAKDLEITNLSQDEAHKPYEWGFDPSGSRYLYKGVLTADLKAAPDLAGDVDKQMDAIMFCFRRALADSAGNSGSNLSRVTSINGTTLEEDSHYFHSSESLAEFKKVYNYLGGSIFHQMMKAIVELDKRKFMVINPSSTRRNVDYDSIVSEIMPLATVLSKYIPDSDNIFKAAEEIAERNQKNDSITQDDIRVPGSKAPQAGYPEAKDSKAGMQLFPHQIEGHKFLRNAPRFAVLDIAPGGGKTIEVLSDIACLVRDKLIKRPIIACPAGLVRNWIEDLHKITQGQWNVIPITVSSLRRWTYEGLTEMIRNAPRNTVCVVAYSALSKSNTFNIIIGNHVEKVSGVLEFVKKFDFDYVALDESHRVKNPSTATHQTIKQLCTASSVKFVRLATGTLISNKLTDVVGQAAMFNSQIFRTPEEYDAENHHWVEGEDGKAQWVWKPDTPALARKQLARHSAVITFKRKEWAFMLPLPQEEFIPVTMGDGGEEGLAHQMMYDAVLKSTIEEIEAEMKKGDSDLARLFKGADEADDPDEADSADAAANKQGDSGAATQKKGPTIEDKVNIAVATMFDKDGSVKNQGMDDATLEELSATLGPYLQRLEMLLTDPLGDEFGETYFGAINKDFISNKVRKVIERIKLNFELKPWVKGAQYKKPDPSDENDDGKNLLDVCDYNGSRYVLMPAPGATADPKLYYAPYYSNIPPDEDKARWKEEKHGKVIVFCRYKRSVNAIYKAMQTLAPELIKGAVKFHGDIKNKMSGLDAFKSTKIDITCQSGVQILIANEQSISEGHNLQMASRMIRVEAPWAPGELDQAAARIFRPDPKGDFGREHIYLDWILTDRTLEVAKMGRLISKMITKAQFDEANNPHYESMKEINLEMKSMGIEALKERSTLADIKEYTDAYGRLAQLVGREFRHMRETKASKMFDIEPEPMFEDAAIIPFVPYVPNMAVPDRNNLGLVVLTEWLQDAANPQAVGVVENPKSLIDTYVHTEMGNGRVKGVRATSGEKRITSVTVSIDGSDDDVTFEPGLIYMSSKLTPEVLKKLPKARKISDRQKKEMEKEKERAIKKAEKEEKKTQPRLKREMTALQKLKLIEQLGKTSGKPVKVKPAKVKVEDDTPAPNDDIELKPMLINGVLAIDAVVFDDDIILDDQHGFIEVKDYAYLNIANYGIFDGVMKWFEKNFYVNRQTWARLTKLHDAFEAGKRSKFDVDQAKTGDFKNFFALYKKSMHTMAKLKTDTPNGKPELKVYPTVMDGTLFLTVDIATNPLIKKYIGKEIPGVVGKKFKIGADSSVEGKIHYRFMKTNHPAELYKVAKELTDAGFTWTNKAEFDEDVKNLKKNHGLK